MAMKEISMQYLNVAGRGCKPFLKGLLLGIE